jgi:two-component system probable response regulator PhcQ
MLAATNEGRYALLFVDDEEKARKYFKVAYEREFPVLTASDVSQALEILETQGDKIGVLITDQRMPGRQGVELLKQAREGWPSIVRVLTTAYSDLDDAIAAVNRGEILRYITKPWDIEALRTELKQAMAFFLLRKERDLLMAEKFSVRQQLVQKDRLRDLLTIAAGLEHLRFAPYAVSAWVRDTIKVSKGEETSASDLELWGLEVEETLGMMSINRRLRSLDAGVDARYTDKVVVAELVRDVGVRVAEGASRTTGHRSLLERLVRTLAQTCGSPAIAEIAEARLSERTPSFTITLSSPGLAAARNAFSHATSPSANAGGLLEAYLIAWHHGGTLCTELRGNQLVVQLTLPSDPEAISLPEVDANWVAAQFAMFESW